MSEQNILNPTPTSLFSPDYGFTEGLPELRTVLQAQSGKMFTRRQRGAGRIYQLDWKNRGAATANALRQWEEQYRNDFFSIADWIRGRYFSGRFQAPLSFSPSGNEQWNIKGIFEELPGLNMYQYPTNWGVDSIFLEERNGFGEDLVKLTGTWTFDNLNPSSHGGGVYYDFTNAVTDKAEWVYFGYGCRIWSERANSWGIFQATVTRVRDGSVMATALVDLYNPAVSLISAPVFGENLLQYSQDFENAAWTKGSNTNGTITVTPDATTAPDGSNTADQVAFPSTIGLGTISLAQFVTPRYNPINRSWICSIWMKAASACTMNIDIEDSPFSGGAGLVCNVTTAWQQFTVTWNAGNIGRNLVPHIYLAANTAATTIFLWGAQLEEGSVARTYIPTFANAIDLSLPLDTYRVTIQGTNTKNALSSGLSIDADALEVMR